jgi:hypothetical protein
MELKSTELLCGYFLYCVSLSYALSVTGLVAVELAHKNKELY